MAYTLDFRKKVLEIQAKNNWNAAQTARHFDISVMSVARWHKKLEPKATRERPQIKIDLDALKKDIEENPSSYMHERAEKFNVSKSGIAGAIKKLGVSNKKKSKPPQS